MNIGISGNPRSGKTSLLERIIKNISGNPIGFITKEVTRDGERIGFDIITSTGKVIPFARAGHESRFNVSRYGLDIKALDDTIGLLPRHSAGDILYVDEIGRMELYSEGFIGLIKTYLDSPNIFVFTITKVYSDDTTRAIRARDDVRIFDLDEMGPEIAYEKIKPIIRKAQ